MIPNIEWEYEAYTTCITLNALYVNILSIYGVVIDWLMQVVDDWQFISLIFDRLLFYVYAIVTLAGTLAILMYAPHIFTDFNQAAFKEELRLERCCKSQAAGDLQKLEDCYVVPAHFKCDLKD